MQLRGDLIASAKEELHPSDRFKADIVWLHEDALIHSRSYLLLAGSSQTPATITRIKHKVDVNTGSETAATDLRMNEIGSVEMIDRPQEGDLIYLAMADRLMYVKYVNKTPVFYQMGAIQMYDLVCEMFEYGSEQLNTGIEAIDSIEKLSSLSLDEFGILTNDGLLLVTQEGNPIIQGSYDFGTQAGDAFEDNIEFETDGDSILDWTQIDPFSEGQV